MAMNILYAPEPNYCITTSGAPFTANMLKKMNTPSISKYYL